MKKIIRIVLCACFFMSSVSAFTDIPYSKSMNLDSQANTVNIKKKSQGIRVFYMPPASEYNYYRTIGKGIQSYSDDIGIAYKLSTPQLDNPNNQLKLLKSVVKDKKADIIIISTHNPPLIASTIKEAVDSGVVVVLVNSDVPDFNTPIHAVVGYNQKKGTVKIGDYLEKISKGKGLNIGILEGAPGYHSDERVSGFLQGIKSSNNLKVVSSENGGWNVQGGFKATLKMLKENKKIDAIFAANDYEIIGAITAAKYLGKKEIIFLGNDGDIAALEKISKGELNATVNTNPFEMGRVSLQVAVDILNGKFSGGFVETPSDITNSSNINDYYKTRRSVKISELENLTVTILTEEFKGLSQKNGEGLYFDILREVYSKYKINLKTSIVPFARGVNYVNYKDDNYILLGGFPGVIDGVYFPQWPYSIDTASVLYKESSTNWNGEDSMKNKKVGMIRNYNINNFLFTDINLQDVSGRDNAIKMLSRNRIDFFLDLKSETVKIIDELDINLNTDDLEIADLFSVRQYACFTDNEIGQKLAEIFDNEFPQLIENGKLKKLFDKWDVKYPY